jgi:hypothetical protein
MIIRTGNTKAATMTVINCFGVFMAEECSSSSSVPLTITPPKKMVIV